MVYLSTAFALFLVSIGLVALIRILALRFTMVDVPNHRSMHQATTPRGGGLAIVIIVLAVLFSLYFQRFVSEQEFFLIAIPLALTACVALIDDYRSLPNIIRALVYAISAIIFFYFLKPEYVWWFTALLVITFIWITNLYNFMDGIDGLAAVQALSVSVFASGLFYLEQAEALTWIAIAIFSSSAGFLVWNWSPAKIFMGDVGSCSLGLLFSILAVIANTDLSIPFAVWLILLAFFITDTTYTLLYRLFRGEKWYQAHKTHAYQCQVERGMKPAQLCILFVAFSICVLWPAAYLAYSIPEWAWLVTVIIYMFFLYTWWYIKLRKTT